MPAAALSIGLFLLCSLIGIAALSLVRDDWRTGRLFLSPAIGFALLEICTIWLSFAGLPVSRFALLLVVGVAVVAGAVLVWKRPSLHWRMLVPFAIVLAVSFVAVAYPLFEFNFNWLSFSNDDMTNYVLGAERLTQSGFFQGPNPSDVLASRHLPALYFLLYTMRNERTGVEMLLALVISLSGRNGFETFMPTIVAFNLALVSSTVALVYRNEGRYVRALVCTVLVAGSALIGLGTLYQLFGQVFGLAMLAAAVAYICNAKPASGFVLPSILLGGVLVCGTMAAYPEITPFLFVTVVVYQAIRIYRRQVTMRVALIWLAGQGAVALVLQNSYLRNYVAMVVSQTSTGTSSSHSHVASFWYYLVPSGPANLFGLVPISVRLDNVLLSLAIITGLLLLAFALACSLQGAFFGEPAAIVSSFMFFLAAFLFRGQNGFGLYKIAMYLQPFLLPALVLGLSRIVNLERLPQLFRSGPLTERLRLGAAAGVLLAFLGINVATQHYYVVRSEASASSTSASFTEIPDASDSHLIDFLKRVEIENRADVPLVSDTYNRPLAKIESLFGGRAPLLFACCDFLLNIDRYARGATPFLESLRLKEFEPYADRLSSLVRSRRPPAVFSFTGTNGQEKDDDFETELDLAQSARTEGDYLLRSTSEQSVLNRWDTQGRVAHQALLLQPIRTVRNHLIFVESSLRQLSFERGRATSIYQPEPGYFFGHSTMSGLGRYLLFEVLNTEPEIRLELSISDTERRAAAPFLPPARVIGDNVVRLPIVGSGAARVLSAPIRPRRILGRSFILLDMGVDGRPLDPPRSGLMNLYGGNLVLDPRILTCYARDISALSPTQVRDISAPSKVERFPEDLVNPSLFFSGTYEDGWASKDVWFVLNARKRRAALDIRGLVPLVHNPDFKSRLALSIDGRSIENVELGLGNFNLHVLTNVTPGAHKVAVHFGATQRLPGGDDRDIGGLLSYIGFSR